MLYLEYSHVCIWYSYKVDFFGFFPHLILRTVNNFHLKILAFYLGPPENLHMYVCLPVIGRKKAGISKYLACPTTPQNWMLSSSSYDNLSWAFTLPLLPNLRDSSTVYDSWKVEDLTTAALTLTRLFSRMYWWFVQRSPYKVSSNRTIWYNISLLSIFCTNIEQKIRLMF